MYDHRAIHRIVDPTAILTLTRRRHMKKVLLFLAASAIASFANANPVVIDPDGLAEGTDITNAYSGVTLRHVTVVNDANGPSL